MKFEKKVYLNFFWYTYEKLFEKRVSQQLESLDDSKVVESPQSGQAVE